VIPLKQACKKKEVPLTWQVAGLPGIQPGLVPGFFLSPLCHFPTFTVPRFSPALSVFIIASG